jgi:hypothetical protein
MGLHLKPEVEARIVEVAKREGVEPSVLLEKMLEGYQQLPVQAEQNELGGKTIGELYGHLLGAMSFEPSDLAERDEQYLAATGFGETNNRRHVNQ